MSEESIIDHIMKTFADVAVVTDAGNSFFFYDTDNKVPFATIVTNDAYDAVSDLAREGVFRLNIGISKRTYASLFALVTPAGEEIVPGTGYDFAVRDQLMPHPTYGRMYWVCVLNPSPTTFDTVRPLIAEAYQIAVTKYERARAARGVSNNK